MKKIKLLELLAVMLLAFSAVPAMAQQGPYVGINIGNGQGKYEEIQDFKPHQAKINGAPFGVQLGYGHQFGRLVVGLETDVQKGGMIGSRTTDICPSCKGLTDVVKDTTRLDWFGTTRVRIGYPVGQFLPYMTGGVAYGSIKLSSRTDVAGTNKGVVFAFSDSRSGTQAAMGGVYGAGLEYALTGNWRVRGEYLRVNMRVLKSQQHSFPAQEVALKSSVFRLAVNYSF